MLNIDNGITKNINNFTYIKFTESFDKNSYVRLNETFPKLDTIIKKVGCNGLKFSNGNRFDMDIGFITKHKELFEKEWITCLENIACESFFRKICKVLDIDDSEYNTFSFRDEHSKEDTDIKIDFQICHNLKNGNSSNDFLRKPHIDSKDKVLVILIYFPQLSSVYKDSDMGQLYLYDKDHNVIDQIRYEHNHGIVFKNNKAAIHAPYSLLNHPNENRRFLNVVFIDNRHEKKL